MDVAKLAERDRARRERQMKKAKRQALVILTCLIIATTGALIAYYFRSPSEPVEKPKPSATAPAVPEQQIETPARAPDVEAKADSKPTAPAPSKALKTVDTLSPKAATSIVIPGREPVQRLPQVGEAKMVLERFLKARTVVEKEELVIAKPGIEARMKEYYEDRKRLDPEVKEQIADFVLEYGGSRFLDVAYKSPWSPSGALRVAFKRNDKGLVLLDWESLVGYGSIDWAEFKAQRPANPVMLRAYATLDDYYNYEFADGNKFLSVRLRSADGQHLVNGFCERGKSVAASVQAHLTPAAGASARDLGAGGRFWAPMIVRLRFPANAASDHCVELLGMVHDQWLAPEEIDN